MSLAELMKQKQEEEAKKEAYRLAQLPPQKGKKDEYSPLPPRLSLDIAYTIIGEFNDLLSFCEENITDVECKQYLKHGHPKYSKKRGGGGWSGIVKATLSIQRKRARSLLQKSELSE